MKLTNPSIAYANILLSLARRQQFQDFLNGKSGKGKARRNKKTGSVNDPK